MSAEEKSAGEGETGCFLSFLRGTEQRD